MEINVLAVGDVCGRAGLDQLRRCLPNIKRDKNIDFTIVNGENANIVGLTPDQADQIFAFGADIITLGNHTWSRYEIKDYLEYRSSIIRPANYALGCPGRGHEIIPCSFGDVCVINLIGKFTLDSNTDNPFVVVDEILANVDAKMIFIDFHGEATSEKLAMAYYLDGRVSAVFGTHTHVQTSDIEIFKDGTGYITDLGMTGPKNGVIGVKPSQSINRFFGQPPERYEAAKGPSKLEGAIFTVNTETGKCTKVEALRVL